MPSSISRISDIMIKKILALAATALVSLNASAAYDDYVQYEFLGPSMTGYFIQHEDNGSIADFMFDLRIAGAPSGTTDGLGFRMGFRPMWGDGQTTLSGSTTYFRNNGPTNFNAYSDYGGDHTARLSVEFSRATQGYFSYTGEYSASIYYTTGWQRFSGTVSGLLAEGTVAPLAAQNLDYLGGYQEFMSRTIPTYINPNQVPEPGSLALLAIGAIGAAGAARRRKAV